MHIHLPKPLHGWREFAGEVGVIVIGIAIALGGEQLIESRHWSHEIAETRKALDAELGRNLAAFDWRWNQRACTQSRLDELDRWARSMAGPAPLKLRREITSPVFIATHTAVWKATSGEVAARMPVEAKLDYAGLYEAMTLFTENLNDEAEAWSVLISYQENRDLTREERHDVRQAILVLRANDQILDAFRQRLDERAAKLGIRPTKNINAGLEAQTAGPTREFCEPLLAPADGKTVK